MSKYRIQPEGIPEIKTRSIIFKATSTYVIEKRKKGIEETFKVAKYKNQDYQTIENFDTKKEMMEWIDKDGGKRKNV